MLNYYLQPEWPAPATIQAFSTTRCRGFSQAPFDQFNLGSHVSDDPAMVAKNQQQLQDELKLPQQPNWLQQIHGTQAVEFTPQTLNPLIAADACYTQHRAIPCAIMTADCVPILLCTQQGTKVAAIHAGWRGLLAGVIENTVAAMRATATQLLAWIGPAIGPNHFEINQDIHDSFIAKHQQFQHALFQPYPKRWFADLFLLSHITLNHCGVTAVYGGGLCTYSDPARFYSYRRDQGITGRMASLIWIEGSD